MKLAEKTPTFVRIGSFLRGSLAGLGRFLRDSPRRLAHLLRMNRRQTLFAGFCLVTLVALWIAEENYRSARDWEKYQREARARGEKLTFAELVLPPVPDDQNFAMTPLLKPIYSDPQYASITLRDRISLNDYEKAFKPDFGEWEIGGRVDLDQWKDYFHQTDVLTELKKYEAEMAEISAAILRPYSRFPLGGQQSPLSSVIFRHIQPLIWLTQLFELRALAELSAHQSDRALEDTLTLLRLAQATNGEPSFFSTFAAAAQLHWAVQVIWEGLAANRWSEGQLVALQSQLQKIDLFPQFQLALQGERDFWLENLEWMKTEGKVARNKILREAAIADLSHAWELPLALPVFALNRAQVEAGGYYDRFIVPCLKISERKIDFAAVKLSWSTLIVDLWMRRNRALHPQLFYEQALIPTVEGITVTFAEAQTTVDEAMVACALERFNMLRGAYPVKLDELVPQFLTKVPGDVRSDGQLHYERTKDGRFKLYSVVSGDREESSKPGLFNYLGHFSYDDRRKDWVWQYPPP